MSVTRAAVVATDVPFGEGPVWVGDGTVVVTSVAAGALYRVFPEEGRAERFAVTGGGANAAALCADGSFLVTQNAGIDFAALGLKLDVPPLVPAAPGLQHVTASGEVSYVAEGDFRAPNDLAVHGDGTVYFTDPPHHPVPAPGLGRVHALSRDGSVRVVADGFDYCNGIALAPDGSLVVVEALGLQRVLPDGGREWVIERLGRGGGDGFCYDAEGNAYVASTIEHGVRVVDPDGSVVDFLEIDGEGLTTNCCFGGADLRTLYATDALPGNVVAWEHMPVPGLPLPAWPGRAR